eukprot:s3479_g3.t1
MFPAVGSLTLTKWLPARLHEFKGSSCNRLALKVAAGCGLHRLQGWVTLASWQNAQTLSSHNLQRNDKWVAQVKGGIGSDSVPDPVQQASVHL